MHAAMPVASPVDPSPSTPSTPAPGTPSKNGAVQTRQKRVLPSRSRRGGPGVGSCDVDLMILETRKRRLENEPLVPAATPFLLTTDSSSLCVPSTSLQADKSHPGLNDLAYGRYFDRPEVQTAYKEQQLIQTPEFTQLADDAVVGGRFRPRGSEDEAADTSDAAYEKRHRKYETFEKRQRLREKEKLKHEQYKLKERIEQLRAMDTSAFLALPASAFSDPPHVDTTTTTTTTADGDPAPSDLHVNGAPAYNEGERRRKEMLDVAQSLEERYRVLLPPDRKWAEKKEKASRASASFSLEPDALLSAAEESERERERPTLKKWLAQGAVTTTTTTTPAAAAARVKQDSDGESEVDLEERDRLRSKSLKLRIRFPPKMQTQPPSVSQVSEGPAPAKAKKPATPIVTSPLAIPSTSASASSPFPSISPAQIRNISAASPFVIRSADGKFLPRSKRYIQSEDAAAASPSSSSMSPSAPYAHAHAHIQHGHQHQQHQPPRKRVRADSSASATHAHAHAPPSKHAGKTERTTTTCVLLVSALRNASAPTARKTQRHVTAFGTRVPPEIEEVRDFEVPGWVFEDGEGAEGEDDGEEEYDGLYREGEGEEEDEDGAGAGAVNGFGHGLGFASRWEEQFDSKYDLPQIATLEED